MVRNYKKNSLIASRFLKKKLEKLLIKFKKVAQSEVQQKKLVVGDSSAPAWKYYSEGVIAYFNSNDYGCNLRPVGRGGM